MRRTLWTTCWWPGLPQLCSKGSWTALVVAAVAGLLLNWALLCSLGWSELVEPNVRTALWATVGTLWLAAGISSVVWGRRSNDAQPTATDTDSFKAALEHYLKGNWFQAERALIALLHRNSRDVEARLMLATLFRHTGRECPPPGHSIGGLLRKYTTRGGFGPTRVFASL